MKKQFHIGDVLSVTTGKALSPRRMTGMRDILGFMTGRDLYDFHIQRALEECKPCLLEQYPQLDDVDTATVTPDNWQEWIDQQVARFGEKLFVHSI